MIKPIKFDTSPIDLFSGVGGLDDLASHMSFSIELQRRKPKKTYSIDYDNKSSSVVSEPPVVDEYVLKDDTDKDRYGLHEDVEIDEYDIFQHEKNPYHERLVDPDHLRAVLARLSYVNNAEMIPGLGVNMLIRDLFLPYDDALVAFPAASQDDSYVMIEFETGGPRYESLNDFTADKGTMRFRNRAATELYLLRKHTSRVFDQIAKLNDQIFDISFPPKLDYIQYEEKKQLRDRLIEDTVKRLVAANVLNVVSVDYKPDEACTQYVVVRGDLYQNTGRQTSPNAEQATDVNSSSQGNKRCGPPLKPLFRDEPTREREKNRFMNYLSTHKLGNNRLCCNREDKLNKAVVCFLKEWKQRGMLDANGVSGAAVFRFLHDDCGLKSDLMAKTYGNKIKERLKNNDYDVKVMRDVRCLFGE